MSISISVSISTYYIYIYYIIHIYIYTGAHRLAMGGAAIAVCGAPSMEDARRPGLAVSSGFRV